MDPNKSHYNLFLRKNTSPKLSMKLWLHKKNHVYKNNLELEVGVEANGMKTVLVQEWTEWENGYLFIR